MAPKRRHCVSTHVSHHKERNASPSAKLQGIATMSNNGYNNHSWHLFASKDDLISQLRCIARRYVSLTEDHP
jgi:hypothetical protein